MNEKDYGSKDIARAAIKMAISDGRDAEKKLQDGFRKIGI